MIVEGLHSLKEKIGRRIYARQIGYAERILDGDIQDRDRERARASLLREFGSQFISPHIQDFPFGEGILHQTSLDEDLNLYRKASNAITPEILDETLRTEAHDILKRRGYPPRLHLIRFDSSS